MSDWNSLYDTVGPMNAGLDIEMPFGKWLSAKRLKPLLASGAISEKQLESMVFHLLRTFFAEGIYDRPTVETRRTKERAPSGSGDADSGWRESGHAETALAAAREGLVLLKNEGALLPLTATASMQLPAAGVSPYHGSLAPTVIAVIGEQAETTETGGGGSSRLTDVPGACRSSTGSAPAPRRERRSFTSAPAAPAVAATPASSADKTAAISRGSGARTGNLRVKYPRGWKRLSTRDRGILATTPRVVCCVGYTHFDESESYDRPWRLPRNQAGLIRECAALNRKIIVILTGGGGIETESWLPRFRLSSTASTWAKPSVRLWARRFSAVSTLPENFL
jgi:beta-glucosidase